MNLSKLILNNMENLRMQSAVYRLHYNVTKFTEIVYVFFMMWPSTLCFVLVKCSKCGQFMLNLH